MAETAEFATDLLADRAELQQRLETVFGEDHDPVTEVLQRAGEQLPGLRVIVWEGDPKTFQFSFVSESAESILGYPAHRWISQADFWSAVVVHPDDRAKAVSFCALATGQGKNHDFRYRALSSAGRVVVLHDVVHVIKGARGVASVLRGVMIDVTDSAPRS